MRQKTMFLVSLIFIFLNINCQNQKKNNSDQEVNKEDMMLDLIKVDFDNDLEKILPIAKFDTEESEFSEYLFARSTKEIELFELGDIKFTSEYKINGIDVPNDSYVSFSTVDEKNKVIQAVHARYNFLAKEDYFLNQLKKQFGEPEILSKDDSVNAFKGNQNFIWKNIQDGRSLIISLFTEGSAVQLGDGASTKINSALIYIVDDAIINYPNGQKEKIFERLVSRFSQ